MKYAATSGHPNHLRIHGVLDHSLVLTTAGQTWIQEAARHGYQLRCLCSGSPSSPLHTRTRETGVTHPYRANETEEEHVPGCIHGDDSQIADAYCAPPGSIVSRNGIITVNFDLLFPDDDNSSEGTGKWQGTQDDHGAALRSLMWLLVVQSGLHCSWQGRELGDPWDALIRGAKTIRVGGGGGAVTLADLLLTPVEAEQKWQGKRNYAKLCGAAATTKRVLVACELTALGRDDENYDVVKLSPLLDVKVDIHRRLVARALGLAPLALPRLGCNQPVLVFGSASAKKPKGGSAIARMNQLIFMPVGPGLVPLPTQRQVDGFARSLEVGTFFSVEPSDDPLIAMRNGLKRGQRRTESAAGLRQTQA